MKTVYLPWTLAAIRRSRGRIVFSQTISPELRLIIIGSLVFAGVIKYNKNNRLQSSSVTPC